eukprot:scaffold865_cov160-Ochromonas_danica.AAC.28
MLERVDTLHSRHLIHRDIKPANFVIGVGEQANNIFCVDFGLSKRYRHPKNLQHIPHRDGRSLTGTPRYASINNHLGIEQSRRDDLESIGYVLIYFLKGSLPWQGLKAKNAQKKYRLILEKKQQVSIAQLCQGCPSQFAEFLAYTRSLKFDAKPDIPYLRKLFRDLYHAQNCASIPKLWDWDGMENDFSSVSGSATQGVTPAIMPTATGANNIAAPNLRPTTAAAIAMDNEMLLGNLNNEDLDEDFGMEGNGGVPGPARPNTAGALLSNAYNRTGAPGGAQPTGNNWGYSRGGEPTGVMMKGASGPMLSSNGGIGDYGGSDAMGNARRPHTAHGARAGFPVGGPVGAAPTGMMYGAEQEEEGDPVVAGARGMMRYRRNRTGADVPVGAPGSSSAMGANLPINNVGAMPTYGASKPAGYAPDQYSGANGSNWAVYQGAAGNSKPAMALAPGTQTAAHLQAQQQAQAMRKVQTGGAPVPSNGAAPSNWGPFTANDRPKSATGVLSAGHMVPTAGAAPMTGARPASGSSMGQSNGNGPWPSSNGTGGLASGGAGSNTLSYGSLKNRFLSGSGGQMTSGQPAPSGSSKGATSTPSTGAAGSGKSKLFSLAR